MNVVDYRRAPGNACHARKASANHVTDQHRLWCGGGERDYFPFHSFVNYSIALKLPSLSPGYVLLSLIPKDS